MKKTFLDIAKFILIISMLLAPRVGQAQSSLEGLLLGAIAPQVLQGNAKRTPLLYGDLSQLDLVRVQEDLNTLGFRAGALDGIVGPATRRAVIDYQHLIRATPTGRLTQIQHVQLAMIAATRRSNTSFSIDQVMALLPTVLQPTQVAQVNVKSPKPTKLFASVDQYPPTGFVGYGIVAFKSVSTRFDRLRHSILCEAFVAALENSRSVVEPPKEQFVTVWPVRGSGVAELLNSVEQANPEALCRSALDNYDKALASKAIDAAKFAGFDGQGVGPFLLGWMPSDDFGKSDALVIVLDLSAVQSYPQAQSLFQEWISEIVGDPDIRTRFISLERIRRKLRRWADANGEGYLSVLNWGERG